MDEFLFEARRRAVEFLTRGTINDALGIGKDGIIFDAFGDDAQSSAIKVYRSQRKYITELRVYQRLAEHGVEQIRGHFIPQLTDWDDRLEIIQMAIVDPPYVLDFAGARLDERVTFDEHVQQWHEQHIQEQFEQNAPTVFAILNDLWTKYGVWHDDISPRNIAFADEPPE